MKIQEIIDKKLVEKNDHKPSGKFKPSSFGFCFRRQYLERLGVEKSNPPDARLLRIFKVGNLFEDFVMSLVGGERQVLVEEDDIKGYADLVTADSVVECKSQHSRKFWHLQKERKEGKSVLDLFPHNWLQVGYYAWKLNKQFAELVLVSKDDLCIEQYKIHIDTLYPLVLVEVTDLRYCWEKQQLPDPTPRLFGKDKEGNPKECWTYCPFKSYCFKLQKEDKNGLLELRT